MRFLFPKSHAWPGGRLIVEEEDEGGALVEFGDGMVVAAIAQREGDDIMLAVPFYRTAKGNEVGARSWRLVKRADGVWRSQQDEGRRGLA